MPESAADQAERAELFGYLLALADESVMEQARAGLAVPPADRNPWFWVNEHAVHRRTAPGAALLTLLEADDPAVNLELFELGVLPPGLNHDLLDGVAFASLSPHCGEPGRVPCAELYFEPDDLRRGRELDVPEILAGLYGAVGDSHAARRARRAAEEIRTAHWPAIAEAHAADPFPGFARWALATRFDCPARLRAAFGTHPKFEHRLRVAGIVGGTGHLVTRVAPAALAVRLLQLTARVDPSATDPADELLRSLIRTELGGNTKAWEEVARSLPGYHGTLAALIRAAPVVAARKAFRPYGGRPYPPAPMGPRPEGRLARLLRRLTTARR